MKVSIKKRTSIDLSKNTVKLTNLIQRGLPKILGNEAVNFFKKSFKNQGWEDKNLVKWKKRKNNFDAGRAILVKSGDLRRSIVKNVGIKRVVISTNVPYAKKHNYGLGRMPKRQFMGTSIKLTRNMKSTIVKEINKILK